MDTSWGNGTMVLSWTYLWKRWPHSSLRADSIRSQQMAHSSLLFSSSSGVAMGNLTRNQGFMAHLIYLICLSIGLSSRTPMASHLGLPLCAREHDLSDWLRRITWQNVGGHVRESFFFFFFKVFLSDTFTCPILGPLVPLFWISGDVSSGFQSQSGSA